MDNKKQISGTQYSVSACMPLIKELAATHHLVVSRSIGVLLSMTIDCINKYGWMAEIHLGPIDTSTKEGQTIICRFLVNSIKKN